MIKRFVLDSYALIGYLENEPFSDRIEYILTQAKKDRLSLYCHMIHLGEVYYIILGEQGRDIADIAYAGVKALPIKLIDGITEELLLASARFKAEYPISYADAFAAGMAALYDCPLMTGDPEFKLLEDKGVLRAEWLT
jgi:ribonuclease VapC